MVHGTKFDLGRGGGSVSELENETKGVCKYEGLTMVMGRKSEGERISNILTRASECDTPMSSPNKDRQPEECKPWAMR
jgi:hypothetical protein